MNFQIVRQALLGSIFLSDCANPGTSWSDPTNLFTTNYLCTDFTNFAKPSRIIRPDGTMQLFVYGVEPLPGSGPEPIKKTTIWTGAQSAYTTVVDGTRQETWADAGGHALLELQTDIASSILISSNFYTYDARGKLTSTTYLDGSQTLQTPLRLRHVGPSLAPA